MTEELKPQEGSEGEKAPEQKQLSEIEQRALDMGWRPREEFDGSDDDFIDAKEFVRRKPLFDKIEQQSKEIKNVRKAVEAWKVHYTAVEKAAVTKALETLKQQRQEAISNADGEMFDKVDSEIKRVEKQVDEIEKSAEVPAVEDTPEIHPEFASWKNKNPWYDSVGYMRKFADDVGVKLAGRGVPPAEVLKEVEKAVRKEFPNKFVNPNKQGAPNVESGSRQSSRGSAKEEIELSDMERRIMNTLVNSKQITKEKYLADLKAVKGIK